MEDNLLHPLKEKLPIDVILSGMVIEVSPPQLLNALFPIVVTLLGMVIEVSPLQLLNALFPIVVTLLGMVMSPVAAVEHPANVVLVLSVYTNHPST